MPSIFKQFKSKKQADRAPVSSKHILINPIIADDFAGSRYMILSVDKPCALNLIFADVVDKLPNISVQPLTEFPFVEDDAGSTYTTSTQGTRSHSQDASSAASSSSECPTPDAQTVKFQGTTYCLTGFVDLEWSLHNLPNQQHQTRFYVVDKSSPVYDIVLRPTEAISCGLLVR